MREGVGLLYGLQGRPEIWVMQALVQLTLRSARSPRSVSPQGLHAEVQGAWRMLRDLAATSEGAKR